MDDRTERDRVIEAGHLGRADTARSGLGHPSPMVRAAAIGAVARIGILELDDLLRGLADPHQSVRHRAITEAAHFTGVTSTTSDGRELLQALTDLIDAEDTAEAAIWALGEQSDADTMVVERLMDVTTTHPDALCREAAVAALGSIGDPRALSAVLTASHDKATVRRRAIIALSAFEGQEVEDRLREAVHDRDWQVSQTAEDLL